MKALISTSYGEITIDLEVDRAPVTVENFLNYIEDGFYNDTIFHRVIPGFMIQGGGMTRDMAPKKTKAPIKNEAKNGLLNMRGTLAMARTQEKDSATSQFFINLSDNSFLDHSARDFGYAVFARVSQGMEVVDKIAGVETGRSGFHEDVPKEPVIINKVELI
jgi:cyclophilin family peptidyl-prolyl cis-trans isomerase